MLAKLAGKVSRTNVIIAIAVGLVVVSVGVLFTVSHATSYFAAADLTQATLSGNASLITDATASSGKAVLFSAPATTPPPTTPPPTGGKISLKIMPLGDSLTQGGVNANAGGLDSTTVNGYRLALLNLLTDYTVDYVGSTQVGDSQLADKDENGFSGACIKVSPCGGGTLYPQTAAWITSEKPDLVIMQGGENDFSDHTLTEQQDATNMESWIQLVWATKPDVKIIVSGAPWHDTYDSLVHTYVSNLQTQGKPIRWVPYGSNIGRIDGTHPNAAGYITWANELAPMVRELFP